MISQKERQQAAEALFVAGNTSKPIVQVSKTWPEMEIEDSYVVQQMWSEMRIKAGARVIGHKIGLTSRAMQRASKMPGPDYGVRSAERGAGKEGVRTGRSRWGHYHEKKKKK